MPQPTEVLQGTLDLMVLKTLDAMGPLHGFGIARRIEQISDGALQLNEGTVYASLLRLQQKAWISAAWASQRTIAKPSSTPSRERDASSLTQKRKTGSGSRVSSAVSSVWPRAGETCGGFIV